VEARLFNEFRQFIRERSGIALSAHKGALVSARVNKRMRALGIDDYRTYLRHVKQDETGEEVTYFLDAISTNVTSFFREPEHFDILKRVVVEWVDTGQKRFRFWSAACSTGEEPYTLAMVLSDALGGRGFDMKILATDISTRVLAHCKRGIYDKGKIETVPVALRRQYFQAYRENGKTFYQVRDTLKKLITFSRFNLANTPFPMKGPFDAVLCRNVMIYFDNEVRTKLLGEIYRLLKPGGYLMVGHAESLTGVRNDFRSVAPSVYIKD